MQGNAAFDNILIINDKNLGEVYILTDLLRLQFRFISFLSAGYVE